MDKSCVLTSSIHDLFSLFKARISLQGVFIDAFYDPNNEHETIKFSENVQNLWNFSASVDPFECKDIKTALTELMEAQV